MGCCKSKVNPAPPSTVKSSGTEDYFVVKGDKNSQKSSVAKSRPIAKSNVGPSPTSSQSSEEIVPWFKQYNIQDGLLRDEKVQTRRPRKKKSQGKGRRTASAPPRTGKKPVRQKVQQKPKAMSEPDDGEESTGEGYAIRGSKRSFLVTQGLMGSAEPEARKQYQDQGSPTPITKRAQKTTPQQRLKAPPPTPKSQSPTPKRNATAKRPAPKR